MCGTKWHTKQSVTPYTWWEPPFESVGAISRTPPLPGVGMTRMSSSAWYCYWPDSVFLLPGIHVTSMIMLASSTKCAELGATQKKEPCHTRGTGHLLNSWGAPLESHIARAWWRHPQCTSHSDPIHDVFNNPTRWYQKHVLFGHAFVWIMVPIYHIRMSSAGVRASV